MMYPNIRTEMERSGFTANQLAARLGLPLDTFVYKLYGKHEFTLHEIECLADLFDCSLDYLVGHMGNRDGQAARRDCMDWEGFFGTLRKMRYEEMVTANWVRRIF